MPTAFRSLSSSVRLRGKTLKHRLNFGAHTANMSNDGLPGERHLGYYRARARGGAAMIVVEPMPVHATGVLTRGNFRQDDDAVIPYFRRITDACHEYGTVMIQQLYHVGAHGDWDNSFEPNWSPSGLPSMHDTDGSHVMTPAEIEELIESFAAAAGRAAAAGFDGCELMAAYNALIEQFWSPLTNRREDAWGGDFHRRMRFSEQVLRRIRETAGPDFIIGMAISVDPAFPQVLSLQQHQEIAAWHDERGLYDYVSVGTGSYFDFTRLIPTAVYEDKLGAGYAEAIKGAVSTALVQAESHIRTPENADYVISSGQADMVSIVRGQIADPDLANKALGGEADRIRPCLSCNHQCWGRRSRDYWISCLINPSAGREWEWGDEPYTPTDAALDVLVVGAGPAGMECARVAAQRGHRVVLTEATPEAGGQFRLAGLQPRRGQILDFIRWGEAELERLGVELRYNTPLDADEVTGFGADRVILATGSQPSNSVYQRNLPELDTLPGIELGNVHPVEDVLSQNAAPGARVLLLDDTGSWRGVGTAWYLLERGHQVILVTPDPYVARELTRTAADIPVRERLRRAGARFITDAVITAWHGDSATVRDLLTDGEEIVAADTLVTACVNTPQTWLARELDEVGVSFLSIGDCVSPRQAPAAIFEGRRLALEL